MKSYDETARSVLKRVEEYNENQNKNKSPRKIKTWQLVAVCHAAAFVLAATAIIMAFSSRNGVAVADNSAEESSETEFGIEKAGSFHLGGEEYTAVETLTAEAGNIGDLIGETVIASIESGENGVTASIYSINGVSPNAAVAAKMPDGSFMLCCNKSYAPRTLGELANDLGLFKNVPADIMEKLNSATNAVSSDPAYAANIGEPAGEYAANIAGSEVKITFGADGSVVAEYLGKVTVFAPESAGPVINKAEISYIFNPSLTEPTAPFTLPAVYRWNSDERYVNGVYTFSTYDESKDRSYSAGSETILEEYKKRLQSEGFTVFDLKKEFIAYRQGCCVTVSKQSGATATLKYFAAESSDGRPADEAVRAASVIKKFYPGEDGDVYVPNFQPVDITPEGCYEATCGRLYYMPVLHGVDQSYVGDSWSAMRIADPDEVGTTYAAPFENAWVSHAVFFITPDYALNLNIASFAAADLDADGKDEFITLRESDAITGMPHYVIVAYENGEPDQYCPFYNLARFAQSEGKLLLIYTSVGTEETAEQVYELCTDSYGAMLLRSEDGVKYYPKDYTYHNMFSSWLELRPGGWVHYPAGVNYGNGKMEYDVGLAACNTTGQITDDITVLISERFGGGKDAVFTKVSPAWIWWTYDDVEIYKRTCADSVECFWAIGGEIYPFGADKDYFSPAYIEPCDFDEDGGLELFYYAVYGEDLSGWRVGVFDLDDMTDTVVTESDSGGAENGMIRINGDYYMIRHRLTNEETQNYTFSLTGIFRPQNGAPGGVTYEVMENEPLFISLGFGGFGTYTTVVEQSKTFVSFEEIYKQCAEFVNEYGSNGAYVCVYSNAYAMGQLTGLPITGSRQANVNEIWHNAIVIEPGKATDEDVLKLACAAVLETADKYCMYDRNYNGFYSRLIRPYIYYAEEFLTYGADPTSAPFEHTVIEFRMGQPLKVYSSGGTDLAAYLAEKYPVTDGNEYTPDEYFDFTLTDRGTYRIAAKRGTELPEKVFIPKYHEGKIIDSVGERGFAERTEIKEIVIPASVTEIGGSAFLNCTSLERADIPDTVTSIGNKAFAYCGDLRYVTVPAGLTELGNGAFGACAITEAVLPEGVTVIKMTAFAGCSELKRIAIPASVTSIEREAFDSCTALTDIDYAGTKSQWANIKKDNTWAISIERGTITVHCTDGDMITY